jgi:hypothetical protein
MIIRPKPKLTLAEFKMAKKNSAKTLFEEASEAPIVFNGLLFDGDEYSVKCIQSRLAINSQSNMKWRLKDNSYEFLNNADLKNLLRTIFDRNQVMREKYWNDKDNIDALTDFASVESYELRYNP